MNIEKLVADMDAIVATAEAENRSLSDEEVARYEGLERDLAAAHKTAEIRSRQRAYKTPLAPSIAAGVDEQAEVYNRAFDTYLRTGEAYELRALEVGSDSAGGYMVPSGFRTKLTERMVAFGGIEQAAQVITTANGQSLEWPTIDDTANSGEIVAEGAGAAAGADPALGTKTLSAYKFTAQGAGNLPVKVSMELLQDSAFDVETFLSRILGKRIQRKKAALFATGTGSSQPLGLCAAAASADVSLTTGTTIVYADLLDTVHALDPDYRANARWVFNDATLKTIRAIVDGNSRPLFNDANAAPNANSVGSLLGYPVLIDQGMPDDSGLAANFAVFGDIEEAYIVRNVKDIVVLVDPYTYSATGQVAYSAWARADGTVQNTNARVILATHA